MVKDPQNSNKELETIGNVPRLPRSTKEKYSKWGNASVSLEQSEQ